MITTLEYIQLKAFARQEGLLIGLLWIATFACFIGSMETPDLQLGFIAGITSTPFVVYYRLKHFRDKILNGNISYRRAVFFVMTSMAYASVLLAGATFAYFYFLDNGAFISTIQESMSTPEIQQSFKQMGFDGKMLDEQLKALQQTRPIDFAFDMLWNGLTSSFMLSLLLGVFGKRTVKETIN
ncbi:MAG: DUF4199 domain-containing protein [Prevotella sp.]|nr:DUF4199 domain-containing protein [Candidatus Prevotella equi]